MKQEPQRSKLRILGNLDKLQQIRYGLLILLLFDYMRVNKNNCMLSYCLLQLYSH